MDWLNADLFDNIVSILAGVGVLGVGSAVFYRKYLTLGFTVVKAVIGLLKGTSKEEVTCRALGRTFGKELSAQLTAKYGDKYENIEEKVAWFLIGAGNESLKDNTK